MSSAHSLMTTRRRTGTYIAIFASSYVCFFLGALLAEQLGVSRSMLSKLLFAAPLGLYLIVALIMQADDGRDFYTAGRRISPYYSGLALAMSAIGGIGVICLTGALFRIGIDALVLPIGYITGLVFVGVLLFPFLRKCGAYTVPSFLGLRLDSRIVRMVAALIMVVPTLLLLAAELRVGAMVATWMTGQSEWLMVIAVSGVATSAVVFGGMRGATWTSVVQAIAALLAMIVPATIVSLLISNLPFPQMMHGNLLRAFNRAEMAQAFAPLRAGVLSFQMPGSALEAFTGPYLQSFGHVSAFTLPFAVLIIATGIAGMPAVLNRAGTAASVYGARTTMGWAVLNAAFILMTLASVAGFMRGYITEQIVNAPGDRLPLWFQTLQQLGFAAVGKTREAVALSGIQMRRDVAFLALPMAAGLPSPLVALAASGALAACLAGASAHILALGGMISEDLFHGGRREAPDDRLRLWSARVAVGVAGGMGVTVAWMVSDPLAVALAAFAISASTIFPVLVLSILWRKVSRTGAVAGMLTGGVVTVGLMVMSLTGVIGGAPLLAAAIGGPANVLVIVLLSQAAPLTSRRSLEVVRDIRVPGGEAIYDREMRLLRRKRATPGL